MGTTVSLPQLGESVDGGTIVAWLVEVGEEIVQDQAIVEVSTDKVDTEIPAPAAGVVTALLADIDEEVTVGQPILELDGGGTEGPREVAEATSVTTEQRRDTSAGSAPASSPTPPDGPGTGPLSPLVKRLLREHGLRAREVAGTGVAGRITPQDVTAAARQARPLLSPLVKRLLREHARSADAIRGTGREGRITPHDVLAAGSAAASTAPAAPTSSSSRTRRDATPGTTRRAVRPGDRVEPLSRSRSIIAQRMLESLQTTAQLTSAVEADVTRLMQARELANPAYRARYGSSLSPLAFVARAVCRTLARHPVLNASIDTEAGTVTYHSGVGLGIAVDAPGGLIVPAIKDADTLTVVGLQRRIADLAARARARELTPDDVAGGTFTITNTGSRGSLFDTPILNPPEVGILATPAIEKRPVVVTDAAGSDTIAIRQRTYLCLTYDHRLVDGADAARFLTDLASDLDSDGWEREVAELT